MDPKVVYGITVKKTFSQQETTLIRFKNVVNATGVYNLYELLPQESKKSQFLRKIPENFLRKKCQP